MRSINIFIKRLMDILGSLLGLIIFLPLFLVISLLIKITSEGPVFFIQNRLGKNGKVFRIFKFRTMINNAEKMGDGIHVTKNDYRITKVGHFLRKFSLDELPQLINVLFGDMSIVGPRPLLINFPKEFDLYSDEEKKRFEMKPGITGLAQINGRGTLTWEEKFKFDINYVNNFTIIMDLAIMFKTIVRVIFPKDIYKDERSSGINE